MTVLVESRIPSSQHGGLCLAHSLINRIMVAGNLTHNDSNMPVSLFNSPFNKPCIEIVGGAGRG